MTKHSFSRKHFHSNTFTFKTNEVMETTNVASLQQHLIIKYIFSYHTAFAKHHLIYDVPDQNGCRNGAELAEPADGSTQLP